MIKQSSRSRALASLFAAVAVIVLTVGFYGHVRAQSGVASARLLVPLRPVAPLSSVKIPAVFGIEGIVADKSAAIQLGKALFWDMQAGSDDVQACATCHFNAGADSRAINQVNPGEAGGDESFQLGVPLNGSQGPNYHFRAGTPLAGFGGYHDGDFPFHKLANPNDRFSTVADLNDVTGSQGVYARHMNKVVVKGEKSVETSTWAADPVFSYPNPTDPAKVLNTRKVTGRNTPSNVNAVFNYRNFWDGRAQNVCNGVNPFGARDKQAHLLIHDAAKNKLEPAVVGMPNSSLCSQALGPILSSVEMSSDGRHFREVGKKLLARQPLALQKVDRTDSVLGLLARNERGLDISYRELIQKAFQPEWWQSTDAICVASDGSISSPVSHRLPSLPQPSRRPLLTSDEQKSDEASADAPSQKERLSRASCPSNTQAYSQMEYNFSLFWGVALQAYESTLLADQTPFDKYLEQQLTYTLIPEGTSSGDSSGGGSGGHGRGGSGNDAGGATGTVDTSGGSGSGSGRGNGGSGGGSGSSGSGGSGSGSGSGGGHGIGGDLGTGDLGGGSGSSGNGSGGSGNGNGNGGQHGPDGFGGTDFRTSYTVQLNPGVVPHTVSVISLNPNLDFSDQDIFGFDDGYGRFIGTGVDGTINYATGVVTVNFEAPPTGIPIKIHYSVGQVPLTESQLRGLVLFQTKGRCIVCHGGPELSNASVDTVSAVPLERMFMGDFQVRVYDTGFYHIGVRTGAEDAGLAGSDPVAGMPLSMAEELQQRVCNDRSLTIMVPGRPGDGITQAPLTCRDDIARTGFFKTPQLRNIALTAPYFHNGSQLTLEQVIEFYNRGGDFNIVSELHLMDPDVEDSGLGLTLQDKIDLVDFLRNALTDERTVKQAAPFDHPQLFLPNGHLAGSNGYPVQQDPRNPGQAITQYMEIPATGAEGGKPLATFLENILQADLPKNIVVIPGSGPNPAGAGADDGKESQNHDGISATETDPRSGTGHSAGRHAGDSSTRTVQ